MGQHSSTIIIIVYGMISLLELSAHCTTEHLLQLELRHTSFGKIFSL